MQSLTLNRDLIRKASDSLKGQWLRAAGAFFLLSIVLAVLEMIPVVGPVAGFLLVGPFSLGFSLYVLRVSRGESVDVGTMFSGFNYFGRGFLAYLLITIYTILWSLLLIIPGILAAFAYSMTFFILLDNPGLGVNDAISESRRLMTGNRWKLFCLMFRFIGWFLLVWITFGIAIFWVAPYLQVAVANFYADIKDQPAPPPVPAA